MTLPWWTGVPRAQATVACGDQTHHLIWENGTLTAVDHADAEGERALAALGGEPLACIALLDAWRHHTEDLDVLLLASRGVADPVAAPAQTRGQIARRLPGGPAARSGFASVGVARMFTTFGSGRTGRAGPGPDADDDEHLTRLLSLGGGIGRRLDATVAAHWCDRLLEPDAETDRLHARLQAALYGRVLAGLVAWLGQVEVTLTLELVPDGAPPTLHRGADGSIVAALPFRWLIEVWARGFDVIWGRFCLAATTTDGREWELLTVGPDLGEPGTFTLTIPD